MEPPTRSRPRLSESSASADASRRPGRLRERPVRFSLAVKIFASIASVLFLALFVAIAASTIRAREIASRSIQRALSRAKDSYDNFQDDRYEKLHRALRVIVDNPGFKALVAQGDPDTLADSLREDQASAAGADFLVVTGPRGVSLARSDRRDWRYDLSGAPMVREALQGRETQGIWYSQGALYHAVAAPVVSGEGTASVTNGVLLAGFAIDERVAESFRDVSNTDVLFFAIPSGREGPTSPVLMASTLGGARTQSFSRAFVADRALFRGVFEKGMIAGPFALSTPEDSYQGLAWPLRLSSGAIAGAVVTARSLSTELAAYRQIEKTLVGAGLLSLLLAFAVSYVLARRMTGPIERMVEATEAVRSGDYDVELPVEQKGEIGLLARSFGRMIEELKEKAELERQIAALTMSGAGPSLPAPGAAAPPADAPAVGTTFAGRYEIESELGAGGMGVVYKARDRVLDDAVAIKVLRDDVVAQDASTLERFKQEIRLARKITHRNVLRTHDFGEAGGLRYLSMEYVRGVTLKTLLGQSRRLPVAAALRIARQICQGLAAAHAVGVIHRDIKPQNILIEPAGGVKIMDFGIARLQAGKGMTATGVVIGTPDYMSPEQAKGTSLDERSDIYSTGVVFFELFTGTLPFEGDSGLVVVLKHIQDEAPAPESRYPEIDPRVSRIIQKAMQKDPDERYQSVADLLADLSEVTA